VVASFRQRLRSGEVLLMDGAMGTAIQCAGIGPGECYESWNLTQPERVEAIHAAYLRAGAQVLLTNTFQANPASLGRHGLANNLEQICKTGIALARRAAAGKAYVLASVGPFPGLDDELRILSGACQEADGLLLETLSDPGPVQALTTRERKSWPLCVSYAYCRGADGGLRTFTGWLPEELARHADAAGVACLGVNCGREIGMDAVEEIIRRYRAETKLPLFARPNAGTPIDSESGKLEYPRGAQEMADAVCRLVAAGAGMIGGCCGTTPEHIAAFRHALRGVDARTAKKSSRARS
jgi:5-methyltetrahydrofolate--homocysteine methyltransferase